VGELPVVHADDAHDPRARRTRLREDLLHREDRGRMRLVAAPEGRLEHLEESGALDAMLDKVATYFEAEVDNAVDGLTSMMEPLIMSFLGVVVGGLIIAMYLPIFQIGQAV